MNKVLCILFLLGLLSCTSPSDQNFDYQEALLNLKKDLEQLPTSQAKTNLLRKTELIISQDSTYAIPLPKGTFDRLKGDIFRNEYFEYIRRQLELFKIDKLTPSDRIEAYKFSYQRSFSDELVFITIYTQDNKNPKLKSQIIEKDRKCNPMDDNLNLNGNCFSVKHNSTVDISMQEWEEFIELINDQGYWQLEQIDYSNLVIFDGSEWMFESVKPIDTDSISTKHIYEASPDKSSPIFIIGNHLLKKVNYDFMEIY